MADSTRSSGSRRVDRVVVIGAGVGGLATALALSRRGHQVAIIERDDTPLPADPEAAFHWDRRGAPQVHHSHVFTARVSNLLRDRYPDVREALLDAGAVLRNMLTFGLDFHGAPEPGDEDLDVLACRRTTFEWVLRNSVMTARNVDLHTGVSVDQLVGTSDATAAPTITGVHLSSGEVLDADLVVATTGRRSHLDAWLAPFGVDIPETIDDVGALYLSRFYRLADDAELPAGLVAGIRAGIGYAVFGGDNRAFSRTLVIPSDDAELRAHLRVDAHYEAACRLLPELAPVSGADFAAPISRVEVMGGLINRIREFIDDDANPRVLGFHAVGDAHTCTNPAYGRGCSLAFVQAELLAAALDDHPNDATARAVAYEAACERDVAPWYHFSVMSDQISRAERERTRSDNSGPDSARSDAPPNPLDPAAFFYVRRDPVLARAFAKVMSLLATPDIFFAPDVYPRLMHAAQAAREAEHERRGTRAGGRRPRVTISSQPRTRGTRCTRW